MAKYISLHNHSSASIGQALSDPKDLIEKTKSLGQTAVAITDVDTMGSTWDAWMASQKSGVKLIIGCEFNFVDNISDTDDTRLTKIVLLAKNHTGYKNILALRKYGFDNMVVHFKKSQSRIDWKLIDKFHDGVICLSAGGNGYIPQLIMSDQLDRAEQAAKRFASIFGDDFALELQPHNLQIKANPFSGDVDQRKINLALKKIADQLNIKCIVATESYYIDKTHHDAHDVLLAIASGQPKSSGQRLKFDKHDFYVKTEDEIRAYFERHKNMWGEDFINKLIDNTAYYADKCEVPEWIDPAISTGEKNQLPRFPLEQEPDYQEFVVWKASYESNELPDDALYYRFKSFKGLDIKIARGEIPEEDRDECIALMHEEFDVLEYRKFSSYMLIVADFLDWSRRNGVIIGPGRGSVGGSITAFLTNIHNSYPKKFGLIFARFLNKYKEAMPDIDSDIAPSGRDKLHTYLRNKYGNEMFANVSNINTITPKVYARDLSRAFEFGGDRKVAVEIGDEIADSISDDVHSIESALESAPLFMEYAKQYPELAQYTVLCGQARAWSTHAGGVIIGKTPLHDIVPIRRDTHGAVVLEYDKDVAESNGLVKIDTLGLETLDIIAETYRIIESVGKSIPVDFNYNAYDKAAYELISNGDTFCVFQLGGVAGSVCKMVKPQNISDIALVSALIRPAAKAIIPDLLRVRNGDQKLELMHPSLTRAFADTYGYGLYEESLLFLAQDVAGWDLHDADKLRKMTKEKGKNPEKVAKWRQEFIDSAVERNKIDRDIATKIWDETISSFGGYGFNKSHATLYSMTSFQTAYLKANFFIEFMTANLISQVKSNSPKAKDNVLKIKNELRNHGVKIIPPDINVSDLSYKIIDDKTLMTGLDSLRNVKEGPIENLLALRPFKDFKDFITRIDSKAVRSPAIQALAATGALDSFGIMREHMFFYCSDYRKKLQALRASLTKKLDKGTITKEEFNKTIDDFNYPFPKDELAWYKYEIFALEEHFLGEGISGTIQERFPRFFDNNITAFTQMSKKADFVNYSDDEKENRKANTHNIENMGIHGLKGIITNIFEFKVKKEDSKIFGQTMARLMVEDPFGNSLDVIAFPNNWEQAKDRIEKQLSGGKGKLDIGVAIHFGGTFQWESPHTYSFILGDILNYKDSPKIPKVLKAKSVKIARSLKVKKKDISLLKKEDLAEALEDEMVFDGISPINDDDT